MIRDIACYSCKKVLILGDQKYEEVYKHVGYYCKACWEAKLRAEERLQNLRQQYEPWLQGKSENTNKTEGESADNAED